jgi:hypothetical protein
MSNLDLKLQNSDNAAFAAYLRKALAISEIA